MLRHALALSLVAFIGIACGSTNGPPINLSNLTPCSGDTCRCGDGKSCGLDCSGSHCDVECSNASSCRGECGDDCGVSCSHAESCAFQAGFHFYLECKNAGECTADCGATCFILCADARCNVGVGDGSTILCKEAEACTVSCDGDCEVSCPTAGTCDVTCSSGAAEDCGNGMKGCGAGCQTD